MTQCSQKSNLQVLTPFRPCFARAYKTFRLYIRASYGKARCNHYL